MAITAGCRHTGNEDRFFCPLPLPLTVLHHVPLDGFAYAGSGLRAKQRITQSE